MDQQQKKAKIVISAVTEEDIEEVLLDKEKVKELAEENRKKKKEKEKLKEIENKTGININNFLLEEDSLMDSFDIIDED